MKNELKRLLALGFISILVFIGCPNDSSGKGPPVCGEGCECEKCDDVDKPPVCENEDCKCQDCDGEECDCNEEQGPQPERGSHGDNTPIPFSHGEVIIRGENLTSLEWQGVVNAIIAALEADPGNIGWPEYFGGMTHGRNVTVIVKNTNEFLNYSTTKGGDTIYININANNFVEIIQNAFMAMEGFGPEMAQAIPQAPKAAQSVAGTTFSS